MAVVITVINQKGGVGKSTTAEIMGDWFRLQKKRVLHIDLDPQCNLSYLLRANSTEGTIWDYFLARLEGDDANLASLVQQTERGDIIASSHYLATTDIKLFGHDGCQLYLKEGIAALKDEYDYIIIDTPPALSLLTINALTASDGVVIPAQSDIFSLQGIGQLKDTIMAVKQSLNKSLKVYGILVVRYTPRTVVARELTEVLDSISENLETKVFTAKIRECTAIKEAQAMLSNIFTYAKRSNAVKDYTAFCKELSEVMK